METPGRELAYFCLSHLGGDEHVWIPRQVSSATPMCHPGTIQSSALIFQEICLLQGPRKLRGICVFFFNSISGGLLLGIVVCQSSGSTVAISLTGLSSLELEPVLPGEPQTLG